MPRCPGIGNILRSRHSQCNGELELVAASRDRVLLPQVCLHFIAVPDTRCIVDGLEFLSRFLVPARRGLECRHESPSQRSSHGILPGPRSRRLRVRFSRSGLEGWRIGQRSSKDWEICQKKVIRCYMDVDFYGNPVSPPFRPLV